MVSLVVYFSIFFFNVLEIAIMLWFKFLYALTESLGDQYIVQKVFPDTKMIVGTWHFNQNQIRDLQFNCPHKTRLGRLFLALRQQMKFGHAQ